LVFDGFWEEILGYRTAEMVQRCFRLGYFDIEGIHCPAFPVCNWDLRAQEWCRDAGTMQTPMTKSVRKSR
jgi:hypothetical protein